MIEISCFPLNDCHSIMNLISIHLQIRKGLLEIRNTLKVGDVSEFDSFMSAVIDKRAFDRIKGYIEFAKQSSELEIIAGGGYDDR